MKMSDFNINLINFWIIQNKFYWNANRFDLPQIYRIDNQTKFERLIYEADDNKRISILSWFTYPWLISLEFL